MNHLAEVQNGAMQSNSSSVTNLSRDFVALYVKLQAVRWKCLEIGRPPVEIEIAQHQVLYWG